MEVKLKMVGHHKNSNITIKGVRFVNGEAMVYGADELVGNICRYLETYGAFQPHEAERRQAIIDGEGDKHSVRAARRRKERLEAEIAKAEADIEAATEILEEKMLKEEAEERRASMPSEEKESASGKVEDQPSTEDRSSKSSRRGKSSKDQD